MSQHEPPKTGPRLLCNATTNKAKGEVESEEEGDPAAKGIHRRLLVTFVVGRSLEVIPFCVIVLIGRALEGTLLLSIVY